MYKRQHKDAVFETDVTGYELLGSEVLLYFNVAGDVYKRQLQETVFMRRCRG